MSILLYIILSTFIVSLFSLIGILTLYIKENFFNKILIYLVAFSAGGLMGGAFLHLLPEAAEKTKNAFIYLLISFVLFYLIEKILHWRHCHEDGCKIHPFAYLNLIGDGVHNFIDGLIIGGAFVVSINLGIVTSLAIIFHEIPQEIGDFGVLVYAGLTKKRALAFNFLSALLAILGGISGYFISNIFTNSMSFLLPFAAGGFIYIAASDLIPELRQETNRKKSALNFLVFVFGILMMYVLKFFI